MTTFEGRTALVTGASGGIGRRIAERLAAAGATLALHYSSHAEPAQELAAALPKAAAFGADLGDADAPDRLVDEVEAVFGPVDVLVPITAAARSPASSRSTPKPSTRCWRSTCARRSCSPAARSRR
jgi:glucose 1-dehydrogenase